MSTNKRIKCIILIIIISILIVFGIGIISYAATNHGDKYRFSIDDIKKFNLNDTFTYNLTHLSKGRKAGSLYCIYDDASMSQYTDVNYKLVNRFIIDGNKTYGYVETINGYVMNENFAVNPSDNFSAAKLAYAISESKIDNCDENNYNVNQRQRAIWYYMKAWADRIASARFVGVDNTTVGKIGKDSNPPSDAFKSKVDAYAKKVEECNNFDDVYIKYMDNYSENDIKVNNILKYNGQYYIRIGLLGLNFEPKLNKITVKGKSITNTSEHEISGVKVRQNQEVMEVTNLNSRTAFSILIPVNANVTEITKIELETKSKTTEYIKAHIALLESESEYWQNLCIVNSEKTNHTTPKTIKIINKSMKLYGNLTITKDDQDNNNIKLQGAQFKLKNLETGNWVHQDANQVTTFTDENGATVFATEEDGTKTIKNLPVGKYQLYETEAPDYYEIVGPNPVEVTINGGGTVYKTVINRQKYVDLSGYVWVDNISGKMSTSDNLRNTKDDSPLERVKVSLQYGDKEVKATYTDKNGYYKFSKVDVDTELGNIVFEYNGLKYTNVNTNINDDNGSKAAEGQTTREGFNQRFSVIEGWDDSRNTGLARSSNGSPTWLNYNNDTQNHISTLQGIDEVNKFPITANTNAAGYNLKTQYLAKKKAGEIKEITNINLGLYIREQPEMILVKDIQSVTVNANNKTHVYEYGNRFDKDNNGNITDNSSRFGVEYGNKFKEGTYERAIYKADYESAIKDNTQLEVYVTYKIAVKNASTSLKTRINSIVDYYDKRYSIEQVGTEYKEGNVTNEVGHTDVTSYNNDTYAKTIINLGDNMKIDRQTSDSVYIKFKLSKDAIQEALDHESDKPEKLFYKNIAEINSYSIFDANDKIYAGIDKKSAPGNIVAGDVTTYENDTDMAPAMKLKIEGTRTMAGSVFLDYTDGQLKTGQVRQGDGVYGDKDKGIEGVDILLEEISGTGKTYTAKTGPDGNFNISDYIAGDYKLTYIWGGQKVEDTEITVQNYKATIYNDKNRQNNKKWYIMTERYSDAFDDMDTRKNIDEQLKNVKYNSNDSIDIKTMKSTTPEMNIEIEYNYDKLISGGDIKPVYNVTNVDFGIVERARQEVELTKRVKTLKLTLANGQVISNVEFQYDKNGKLTATGEKNHMTFMGTNVKGDTNRFIKLELDNELIQGANLEVGYEILFKNKSEKDYNSEDFYKYGIINSEVVKITPTAIIDYLDRDWSYEESKNEEGKWEVWTLEELKTKDKVAETVYDKTKTPDTDINNRIVVYTEKLSEKTLEPSTGNNADKSENSVMLNVSKILTTTDEILLGNETEIVELNKTGGAKITSIIPGDYVPGSGVLTDDADEAEEVTVTPSTGENLNYVLPITIGLLALITLGTGVILIKKKVL